MSSWESKLIIYGVIAIIILIAVLFFKCRIRADTIAELKGKLKTTQRENDQIMRQNREMQIRTDNLELLRAEYLRLREQLVDNAYNICFKNGKKHTIETTIELQKNLRDILKDYESIIDDPTEKINSVSSLIADYITYPILLEEKYTESRRGLTIREIRKEAQEILRKQYEVFYETEKKMAVIERTDCFLKILELQNSNSKMASYFSKIIADVETADFELYIKSLDYGNSVERQTKIQSIRDIKAEAKEKIEKHKWAEYQLAYLLAAYPDLEKIVDEDFDEKSTDTPTNKDGDPISNYLSETEWRTLSETQRNQLALDRYVSSNRKTKWQIGRDYELYIGYLYEKKGYTVDYCGSYLKYGDLGRDLIVKGNEKTYIVQCKYWSQKKEIHEKHIMQLYGSLIAYRLENKAKNVTGVFVTNINLSETAKKFAKMLKITTVENKEQGDFPRIKCNINYRDYGKTLIYHLPMDDMYDSVKIDKPGEFYAFTVEEAERRGFRRAFKWHPWQN